MSGPGLQTRRTPPWLFRYLDHRFGPFKLDAAAEPHNALLPRYYTARENGFISPWLDVTFCNSPFEVMLPWVAHAVDQAERSSVRSILLAPVGCSQEWYHRFAIRGTIYQPDTRINYDEPDGTPTEGADRDTIVMGFGGEHANPSWRRGIFRVRRLPVSDVLH